MKDNEKVCCHVREYRLRRGWSQEVLARQIGLRRQAIYDIESSRYLPNTGVALRLAAVFGCQVEDLFVPEKAIREDRIQLLDSSPAASPRIELVKVRDRLVGFPLAGRHAMFDGFRAADALLDGNGQAVDFLNNTAEAGTSALLLGCDPAFQFLDAHVARLSPGSRVNCHFASSHRAVNQLAAGYAHIAGTHLHNTGDSESNVALVNRTLNSRSLVIGFSQLEEGLIVAKGNPCGLREIADLAQPNVRLINREPGAALRVLLDDHLARKRIPPTAVNGYDEEVRTHMEGALRVASRAADAALGFRAVADNFELDFVPITSVRCDLVIPGDLFDHPTLRIILDVLQSAALKKELASVPGYDAAVTGQQIAGA